MQEGKSFDEAYHVAYQQTTPNGFEEIQYETFFLLNHKKLILMKQFTYISGYLFALSTTAGAFFKIMHFPGAALLLLIGLMGISFIFLPLLLFNKFKDKVFKLMSEKLKWIFGTLSLMLILVGSCFKVLHLPGAMVLLGLGMIIFGILFLPFLFFRMFKSSQEEATSQ
ncbi:GldL-related protein [Marivirga sp.]|uniref:GldL-related protein n=1 Tax=Marivirga sp. TaxID=2018662 RepID=UPI003DA71419